MKVSDYIHDDQTLIGLVHFEQSEVGRAYLAALQRRLDELRVKLRRPRIVREGDFSEDALGQLMEMQGIEFAMSMIRDAKTTVSKKRMPS